MDERRKRTALGVLVAAAIAVVGFALGAGWSPGGPFGTDEAPDIDRGVARVVAADEDSGGSSIELWAGPSAGGDEHCAQVRAVWPDGALDAPAVCADPLLPWDDETFTVVRNREYFGSVTETPIGSAEGGFVATGLTGWVHPDVTAITARFGDGSEYSFSPRPPDGWFATVVPSRIADRDRETGRLVNGVVSLRLFDSDGRALTTIDDPALLP